MKRFYTIMAALLVCGVVYAAQDTDISLVEARNPKLLRTWLNANATDAEARLAAGGSVADRLTLNNPVDAGTASIVMQADKGDNAGDKWGIVASDGSGLLIQSDASSLGVLATKVTIGTTGIITLPGGATLDNATSATALTITETTVAVVGAATVSGSVTASGGLTVTEDIVVTLDATDEEISIAQTDTTGASGVPMMFINDDRTGGNADQAAEATISIDAEGVYGLAINDGALYVEGVSLLVGNVTLTGDIDIDGGDITCPADLTITPTGNDVLIDGGLTIGDATQAGDNNLRVAGTSALVGVATFTALPVFNAGLDVNEDIDIDLDAVDEEINITQSAVAGTADTPLILINDDRTGATANTAGEATLKIDAEGTHAIAVLDGIVAVESILDTYAAGALLLGSAEATSLNLGASDITTSVVGPLTAPRFTAAESTTNALTLTSAHYGTMVMINTNAAVAVTLPANGAASGSWIDIAVYSAATDACAPTISAATADTLITPGSSDSDSVTWDTGHRIGAYARFWSDGAYWHVSNLGGTTMTYTDSD